MRLSFRGGAEGYFSQSRKWGLQAEVVKLRGKVSVRLKTTFKGEDGIEVEGGSRILWRCCSDDTEPSPEGVFDLEEKLETSLDT